MNLKRYSFLAASAAFAIGCGGSGDTTDTGGDGGKTLEFWPIVTNVTGAIPPPLITSGSGVVITGVYGGRVNDLRLKRPSMNTLTAEEIADQTFIAFNQLGHPSLLEYANGNVTSIALESGASVGPDSYNRHQPGRHENCRRRGDRHQLSVGPSKHRWLQ